MADETQIPYVHATFNPHLGCAPIAAGCKHCYARGFWRRRHLDPGDRQRTSPAYWRKPLTWERQAAAANKPRTVLCGSLCDVFELPEALAPPARRVVTCSREDLRVLIDQTPHLRWLILTKRLEGYRRFGPQFDAPNIWCGVSISTQADADRAEALLPDILAREHRNFWLSAEPLIEPVLFARDFWELALGWVVLGGESAQRAKARYCDPHWLYLIWRTAQAFGVPAFVKQLGTAWAMEAGHWRQDHAGRNPRLWPPQPYGLAPQPHELQQFPGDFQQ
jgi:protein gp37